MNPHNSRLQTEIRIDAESLFLFIIHTLERRPDCPLTDF